MQVTETLKKTENIMLYGSRVVRKINNTFVDDVNKVSEAINESVNRMNSLISYAQNKL